jgi:hypothetical protein
MVKSPGLNCRGSTGSSSVFVQPDHITSAITTSRLLMILLFLKAIMEQSFWDD